MNRLFLLTLIFLSALMWASQSIMTKKIHGRMDMYDFFVVVYVLIGIICIPYILYKRPSLKIVWKHSPYIALWGITTVAAALLFFYCIAKNPSGVSATVCIQNTLTFVLVVLLSWVILGEPLTRRHIAGILLSIVAIYMLA